MSTDYQYGTYITCKRIIVRVSLGFRIGRNEWNKMTSMSCLHQREWDHVLPCLEHVFSKLQGKFTSFLLGGGLLELVRSNSLSTTPLVTFSVMYIICEGPKLVA